MHLHKKCVDENIFIYDKSQILNYLRVKITYYEIFKLYTL